jgi:glycerophosphoryl diester phosphodiesterase
VHLTADGERVIIHDANLRRACGVDGFVEEKTLPELRQLRLFRTSETIPTLEEVLEVYEAGEGPCPPLVVEVKARGGNYAKLTEKVMATLDAHRVPYCMESFDPRVLWWLRRQRPEVIRGQLAEHFLADSNSDLGLVKGIMAGALAFNVVSRPDFVAYRYEHRRHPAVLLSCGPLGAWRVYWTVQDEDGLTTADAEHAVSIFEGFNPEPTR